jgi:thymidine kinase
VDYFTLVKIDTNEAKTIIDRIRASYRDFDIGAIHVDEIQLVAARPYLSVSRIETLVKIPLVKIYSVIPTLGE